MDAGLLKNTSLRNTSNRGWMQWQLLPILLVITAGASAITVAMKWGPWAFTDSVAYFEAARNLAAGAGLVLKQASGDVIPLSLHAPLYPILLAVLDLINLNLVQGAKILNVLFFSTFILTICMYIYRVSETLWVSISAGFVLISNPIILRNFTGIMTEPLFFVAFVLSFILLSQYFQNRRRIWLIGSIIFASISLLERFAGIVVILTVVAGILILDTGHLYRRLLISILALMTSVLPFGLWMAYVSNLGGNPRTFELAYASMWERLAPTRIALVNQLWEWLPFGSTGFLGGYRARLYGNMFLVFAVFSTMFYLYTRWKKRRLSNSSSQLYHTGFLFLIFTAIYAAFLLATYSVSSHLYDAPDERMMSPMFVGSFLGGLLLLSTLLATLDKAKLYPFLGIFLGLLFVGHQFRRSVDFVMQMNDGGLGYTSKMWQHSEVAQAIDTISLDTALISNDIDAIMFFTNRPAFRIPELELQIRKEEFRPFGAEVKDDVQRIFKEEGAALILFDSATMQFAEIYGSGWELRFESFTEDLCVFSNLLDGTIYFYNP
jgi:hypothetical protein